LRVLKDFALFESDVRFERPTEFFDQFLRKRCGVAQRPKARVVTTNPSNKLELFENLECWEKKRFLDLKMRLEVA